MERFAAIDVGSNALRIQVVGVDGSRPHTERRTAWVHIARRRVPLRLGHDVFLRGELQRGSLERACDALQLFRRMMDAADVDRYRAVATGAVCQATNGRALLSYAEGVSRIRLEPIDDAEAARLVTSAVSHRLALKDDRTVLVHLAGGSATVTLVQRGCAQTAWSLPVGTVRLLKDPRLTCDGRFDAEGCALLDGHIRRFLQPVMKAIPGPVSRVIATGGNVRALARLCPSGVAPRDAIDVRKLRDLFFRLAPLPATARCFVTSLGPGRADVVVPASDVLYHLANQLGVENVETPKVGLKESVLDSLVDQAFCSGFTDKTKTVRVS